MKNSAGCLQRIRGIPGVKHVFIGSGIRYDLALADDSGYLGTDL